MVVVGHCVLSVVEGEGILLVSFSHADFPDCSNSNLSCHKKEPRYEINRGEKSLFCCRYRIITYRGLERYIKKM